MTSSAQKREICGLLKHMFLKICQRVVPYTEQLELHGLLLLETDGHEFCTVSFKDVKLESISQSRSRSQGSTESVGQSRSRSQGSTESVSQSQPRSLSISASEGERFSSSPETSTKKGHDEEDLGTNNNNIVNWAVQNAMDIWEGVSGTEVSGDEDQTNSDSTATPFKIHEAKKSKRKPWRYVNLKPDKNKNGKFECSVCLREFSFATNLTRHQRSHHGRPQLRNPKPDNAVNQTGVSDGENDKHSDKANKREKREKRGTPFVSSDVVENVSVSVTVVSEHGEHHLNKDGDKTSTNDNVHDSGSGSSFHQHDSSLGQDKSGAILNSSGELNPLMNNAHGSCVPHASDHSDTFLNNSQYHHDHSQGSISLDLNSSYMPPTFQPDDMYFSMPDAISTPESAPRIFQPLSVPLTDSETRCFPPCPQVPENVDDNSGIPPDTLRPVSSTLPSPIQGNTSQNSSDTHHLTATTVDKAPAAPDSSMVFKTKGGKEYVNMEDSEKPTVKHKCPICQRTFDFYQNLGRHAKVSHKISIFEMEMRQNGGGSELPQDDKKKKFRCEICGNSFSFRSNLCRHKSKYHRDSSKEEPVKKSKPDKSTQKETMPSGTPVGKDGSKDAVNTGSGRHKCDICGGLFTFTSSLSRHMRRKHNLVRASLYKPTSSETTNQNSGGRKFSANQSSGEQNFSTNQGSGKMNFSANQGSGDKNFATNQGSGERSYSDERDAFCTLLAIQAGDCPVETAVTEFAVPLSGFPPYSASSIGQSDTATHSYQETTVQQQEEEHNQARKAATSAPNPPVSGAITRDNKKTSRTKTGNHGNNNRGKNGGESDQKHRKEKRRRKEARKQANTDGKSHRAERQTGKPSSGIPAEKSHSTKQSSPKKEESPGRLPTERYKHFCNICKKKFTFRTNLTRHMRKVHGTAPEFPKHSATSQA